MLTLALAALTPFSAPLEAEAGFSGVALRIERGAIVETYATDPAMIDGDWRWASISKLVLATAILQAVEDGLLALEDPVALYLEAPDQPGLTVRDLLRHTSGLADPDMLADDELTADFDPDLFCFGPPIGRPGEAFRYNNCDSIVAARVLETVRGEAYAAILSEHVFEPAGMSRSRLGAGADRGDFDGRYADGTPAAPFDLRRWGASGGVVGPAENLVRFADALTDGTLLAPDSLSALRDGEGRFGFVSLGAWAYAASLEGCEGPVGLIERRGHIRGVQSRLLMAPDLEKAIVVFADTDAVAFGEIWTGRGLTHALASAAFCTSPAD